MAAHVAELLIGLIEPDMRVLYALMALGLH